MPPSTWCGEATRCSCATRRKVAAWVDDQLASAGLHVDREGTARLVEWLGEDAQKLVGVIETLVGSFGVGARLGAADLEPFLGESGGVPPWELTDALDRGDITTALDKLHRMVGGGGPHPLQVMATLHGHYARMLQLDGAPVRGEKDAAQLLRLRGSTFPARKALQQARRLGHDRVVEAVSLLAGADLDLRGGKAWPEGLGLGGLGARLARLGRWRAAWFLWMTPLVAAESMRLTARRSLASASSAPPSTAATAALARVLSSERTALLRSWRTRFWRLRLIWLLMFATGGTCSFESDSTAYVAGSSVCRASRSCLRRRRAALATASPTLG